MPRFPLDAQTGEFLPQSYKGCLIVYNCGKWSTKTEIGRFGSKNIADVKEWIDDFYSLQTALTINKLVS
jgi:uncharacterized membrane protein